MFHDRKCQQLKNGLYLTIKNSLIKSQFNPVKKSPFNRFFVNKLGSQFVIYITFRINEITKQQEVSKWHHHHLIQSPSAVN